MKTYRDLYNFMSLYAKTEHYNSPIANNFLDQDITISISGEFFKAKADFPDTDGILDENHLVLVEIV
jgi:hypothetical protein